MKPVVGVMQAWSCIVISVFAVIILSIIGALFKSNNHALLGGKEDPDDGAAVAATVFSAVVVYA
ncbi:V-type proton ATPase subunit f [Botrytis cinerea]